MSMVRPLRQGDRIGRDLLRCMSLEVARLRLRVMSVLWPLSDEKRKWLGHRQTDAIDPERT
jgi:hypothetical protein